MPDSDDSPRTGLFRAAVGELAQQAATLEAVVAILAWGLAGLDQTVARIVVPNDMDRMLQLSKELLPIRVPDEELRSTVLTWLGDVKAAYSARGSILHSVWVGHDDMPSYMRFDIRPFRREVEHRTAEDVRELAAEMAALSTIRAGFLGRLAATVPGPWAVSV